MKRRGGLPRPSLAQVFVVANLALAVLLGALFLGISRGSESSLLRISDDLRRSASAEIARRISEYLDGAARSIDGVERAIHAGLCRSDDPLSVESELYSRVLDEANLAEISLTRAEASGSEQDGGIVLSPSPRWQVAVYRDTVSPDSAILTAWVTPDGGRFRVRERRRPGAAGPLAAGFRPSGFAPDPTEHPTFRTPASRPFRSDRAFVWSDLSFFERDSGVPEARRRVVVTVMRAIEDGKGRFLGVLRAGMRTEAVDRIVREEEEAHPPNLIVLCDSKGRLITRRRAAEPLVEQGDGELRVQSMDLPVEIDAALRDPSLARLESEPESSGRFSVGGRFFLVNYRVLSGSQGWRVGVIVAEDALLKDQLGLRARILTYVFAVCSILLAGGVLTLQSIRHSLGDIEGVTERMRGFDFAASKSRTLFRDVDAVMNSLELAKTAMRAMSRYVPVDLVRLLYKTGREPVLGGQLQEVSLLFSDIKDFTTLSERVSPNELAAILGRYLQVMTEAIQATHGTIDKYIGDAIMAVWNAPTALADHPQRACEAALSARSAAERLFSSPEWGQRSRLVTRFGLHTGEVMVGHFGAPDRMSYTCLGDGVNLAARLEGLNKVYDTTILVSAAVEQAARGAFAFRFVDQVAVKGKTQGVGIYELLASGSAEGAVVQQARRYEEAWALYSRRDFEAAVKILDAQGADGPSRTLASRCRGLLEHPPPADWNGVWTASEK